MYQKMPWIFMLINDGRGFQFIKFLAVGGFGAFGYIFLSSLISNFDLEPWTSSFIGYSCMIPVVYLMQRVFVFQSENSKVKSFIRYLAIQFLGLLLSVVLPYLLNFLNVLPIISFLTVSLLAALASYFLQLRWAFADAQKPI